MRFVLTEVADLRGVAELPGCTEINPDLIESIIEEAAKFAADVLSPLNRTGDKQGAMIGAEGVVAPDGFKQAYHSFVSGGWNGLGGNPAYDGQGLPALVVAATAEMWYSANMSFALCPSLTAGAVETISAHASEELKAQYLSKLVSGAWSGTMNLTEPQAGSDLAAVRTRAIPEGDHYLISGQKIFITWGDHDMAENIVHLVLARLPDAPEGVRGISLFLVPKFLVRPGGSLGERNDVRCASIEHKLGIHASPTCVMMFGQGKGAIGYLIGERNQGLAHMFTMMNEARQKVGVQGLAIADRAYQQAREYAKERVQGRASGKKGGERVTIIQHPDVRRMLMTMKSQIEAMRAFCYMVSVDIDFENRHPHATVRAQRRERVELLTPVVKGWCTETAVDVASLGVQIHGGVGYIEETGAAQHLRDARIAPIYEGTTGIQAADLVGRKLSGDGGHAMRDLLNEMRGLEKRLKSGVQPVLMDAARVFGGGVDALEQATEWLLDVYARDRAAALGNSVAYLMLTGYVCGGWQMIRSAEIAIKKVNSSSSATFYTAKLVTAQFYLSQILPRVSGLLAAIRADLSGALNLGEEWF